MAGSPPRGLLPPPPALLLAPPLGLATPTAAERLAQQRRQRQRQQPDQAACTAGAGAAAPAPAEAAAAAAAAAAGAGGPGEEEEPPQAQQQPPPAPPPPRPPGVHTDRSMFSSMDRRGAPFQCHASPDGGNDSGSLAAGSQAEGIYMGAFQHKEQAQLAFDLCLCGQAASGAGAWVAWVAVAAAVAAALPCCFCVLGNSVGMLCMCMPRHATPRHATPRHATPCLLLRSSTAAAPADTPSVGPLLLPPHLQTCSLQLPARRRQRRC
jgi:hypothetical protein